MQIQLISKCWCEETCETGGVLIDVDVNSTIVGETGLGVDPELPVLVCYGAQLCSIGRWGIFCALVIDAN